ncbi:MAG TPA: DUF167 domain-containing protein [Stellaceae bacterium]|nr:DUF167 domain-containing protein [Stellaceae bacterium]
MSESPLFPVQGGVDIRVRLSPRAAGDRVLGLAAAAGGGRVVKAAVAAPPEDGRANAALLRLVARQWKLPRRDLEIVAGEKSRDKRVRVAGDPRVLLPRLAAILAALGEA